MDKIYTLSVVNLQEGKQGRTRCWGWWHSFAEAGKAFLDNPDFWLENGYYDHCVIEEVGPGFNFDRLERWYSAKWISADVQGEAAKYDIKVLAESPCPNVVNWSIG